TMDLQDDSLVNVAKRITQLSNQNIIVLPELSAKKVNGYFQELPVGGALEKLALSNAMKVNQGMDSSYIIEALRPNAQVGSQQTPVNGSISVRESAGKKLISLDVIGVPIKDVIRSIADQGNINYFIYSDITGSTTAKVHDVDFDKVLELVLKSTNYTYNIDNGIYMIGDRQDEGFRSSKLIELKYRSVDSLLPLLPAELMKGVTVKEFREYNSFLLNGSEPQIKEIDSFIRALDKTVPMVMIEVILMDVQKTRTIATGLQLGVSDSVRSGGTLFGAGTDFTFSARDINRFIDQLGINNAFNIGRVTPNFYASLRALESNSNVEIRQTPKLSTLNGHEANLSIGSRRYYSITTQNVVGALDARTIVTQEFFPVDANLAIKILPFVSGDEHATLKIDVNISDFIGNPPLNLPPPTATSKFNTILRVKNEEMVVLGGIERNEKTDETSGTPLLSRIPILKWLFSSKSKTTGKTYSVVFIKPTIIY
ncbi:MAG TPA: secretin and TonB N-terminal domain-containing protein, partial [Chitinophagaceae bacterium]|nr:secretin and TonB N-terminal domain-containing protein [Chitinophagaceae bacterium]